MSLFYTEMQEMAAELLTEFGATGTLTKAESTVSDTNKPWENKGDATPTTETIIGAAVPVTDRADQRMVDELGAYVESRWILISTKDLEEEVLVGDSVSLAGNDWKLIKSTPIQPADIVVMYSCLGVV